MIERYTFFQLLFPISRQILKFAVDISIKKIFIELENPLSVFQYYPHQ